MLVSVCAVLGSNLMPITGGGIDVYFPLNSAAQGLFSQYIQYIYGGGGVGCFFKVFTG